VTGVGAAFLVFSLQHQVISVFDGGLALTLPVILTTGLNITDEINRRRRSEFFLQSVVQVSQQRLVLTRIMPSIAADVRRIVPAADIAVWRCSLLPDTPQLIYPRQARSDITELAEVTRQVSESGVWAAQRGWVVLPIAWQKRRVGVLGVTRSGDNPISKDSVALLQALAEQLAPSLENAFLYAEIERQHVIQDAILSGSPAGILVLDHRLYVRRSNDVFDTVFKAAPETYLNQPFSDLLETIHLDARTRQAIEQALAKGESFRLEIAFEHRTFNLDAAPQPQFELWVLVITEITHLIQLSELKTYMIRMLSHDLGNPLSRILGYGQLLAHDRDSLSETHQQFVDFIIHDGEEMDRIITDVLNLEHLRSGELVTENVDLRHLVVDLANRHEPEMIHKQHHCTVKTPDAPVIVRGNYRQLSQAIMNLLNNAIKYTPDGGQLSIELSAQADCARVAIADNGYGIPQNAHAKIFTEFYRVKSRATVDISGTGLGLSLVKLVIDNHGGRVWFESEEGVGSTFFVELPLEQNA
jgi:signal transduction histidine kinase